MALDQVRVGVTLYDLSCELVHYVYLYFYWHCNCLTFLDPPSSCLVVILSFVPFLFLLSSPQILSFVSDSFVLFTFLSVLAEKF